MFKNNGFFLRRRVARQKIMDFFCAAGLHVKKRWPFSAPQGCKSQNNGFFLRRRVACQETVARFLRRRVARQKNDGRFLRCRVASQKTMAVFCQRRLTGEKSCDFTASSYIFSFATASQFGKNTYLCIAK